MSIAGFVVTVTVILALLNSVTIAQTQYDFGNDNSGYQYYGNNCGYGYQQQIPGGASGAILIKGLEGLQGFGPGQNRLGLAVQPVSQQDNMLYFQVIGFAITNMDTGQAAMYSLNTPFAGVIDPSRNTMQIDISNIDSAVDQSAFVDGSQVYSIMRNSPQVTVIDLDLTYQDTQDAQTVFTVNGIDIVPPDGNMRAFSLQQPTQLIIDAQNYRIDAVTFPEMIDAFSSSWSTEYPGVSPVTYAQPEPVLVPVYAPYIEPIPIAYGGYVPYSPFYFPYGYRPFPHVFPHPTGLVTPTPHFPTLHPTMHPPTQHPTLHPTMHPPTSRPTGHPTGFGPTGHPTGFSPSGHPTLQKPDSQKSGLTPANQLPSNRITTPTTPGSLRTPSTPLRPGMGGGTHRRR